MTLATEKQGDYLQIVEFLEERMRSYFEVKATPGAGEVAEALSYFPYNFGAGFPVGAVQELTHEGEDNSSTEVPAPGIIDIGVRIYTPSLWGFGATIEDGRDEARRITRAVYSAWRSAFYRDYDLRSMVRNVSLGRVEFGDHDTVGNPFISGGSPDTILWVHGAVARFNP